MIDSAFVVARTLHFCAVLALEGLLVFQFWVLRPISRGGHHAFPQRFQIELVAVAVALISGLWWVGLLGANLGDTSFLMGVRDGSDWLLLTQTLAGKVWLARLAGLVLLAVLLPIANRLHGDFASTLPIVAATALAGSLAWSGHGASTEGIAGDAHLAADILHLIAAGVWVGGLLPFAVALTMKPHNAAEITRRFSSLATACVLVLVATGIINVAMMLDSLDALTGTLYGRLLLAKLALFLLMLALAGVNRFVLTPRLASSNSGNARSRLIIHSGCEIALGVAILGLVGLLGTLAPFEEHHHQAMSTSYSTTVGSAVPRSGRSGIAIRQAMPHAATKAQAANT